MAQNNFTSELHCPSITNKNVTTHCIYVTLVEFHKNFQNYAKLQNDFIKLLEHKRVMIHNNATFIFILDPFTQIQMQALL